MATDSTRDAFFRAVEDAGGEVVHNRIHKDERGRFIPEIRLTNTASQQAKEEREQRIIAGIVAEHDRLAAARAERDAFAHGAAQDAARWQLAAQIALTADARARFLADSDEQSPDDPLRLAFRTAVSEEMRLRREYFDAFGTPYDDEE